MNKTILVTGASSGFGEAIATQFAQNGYTVCITGRREERLQALKQTLESTYGVAVDALVFDIRNKEEVEKAVTELKAKVDRIDILVNNAGLAAGLSSIEDGNTDAW